MDRRRRNHIANDELTRKTVLLRNKFKNYNFGLNQHCPLIFICKFAKRY